MSDVLLFVILLVSTASFALTIRALRSSRRSERFGEDHRELLLDQQDQLRLLREGQDHQRLIEELEAERKEHLEAQHQLESLKQQLLEREQKERFEAQQHLRRLEEHLLPLEQERQRLTRELGKQALPAKKHQAELSGTYRFQRRKHIWVVLVLLSIVVTWLVSLISALYILNS